MRGTFTLILSRPNVAVYTTSLIITKLPSFIVNSLYNDLGIMHCTFLWGFVICTLVGVIFCSGLVATLYTATADQTEILLCHGKL